MSAEQPAGVNESSGEYLRRLRAARGLSPEALADAVGASRGSVDRWEKGANLPQARRQQRLAEVLEVDPAELARGLGLATTTNVYRLRPSGTATGEGSTPGQAAYNEDQREFVKATLDALLDGSRSGNPTWVASAAATAKLLDVPWEPQLPTT